MVAVVALVSSGCGGDQAPTEATAAVASVESAPTTTTSTTVVPTTTTTSAPAGPSEDEIRALVDGFVAEQPVAFSVVVSDLDRGTTVVHDPDREVWSASLYKLFVARELLRQIDLGALDRNGQAGDARGRTWGECLRDMIVVSDDDCGLAGIDHVGRGGLDPTLALAGFPGTHLDNPQRTTAADVARFLTAIHRGTLLGPDGADVTAELRGWLAEQQVGDRLSLGFPPGTPFAHKTGDRTGWAHDAGIVTAATGDWLIVALSGPYPSPCCHAEAPGPAEATAFAAFADLAARLWALVAA